MRRRGQYLPIKELSAEGNRSKHARIMSLQPRLEHCGISVKRDMFDVIDQLVRYPKGRHDDIVDALAYMEQLVRTPSYRAVPDSLQGVTFQQALDKQIAKEQEKKRIGWRKVDKHGTIRAQFSKKMVRSN